MSTLALTLVASATALMQATYSNQTSTVAAVSTAADARWFNGTDSSSHTQYFNRHLQEETEISI